MPPTPTTPCCTPAASSAFETHRTRHPLPSSSPPHGSHSPFTSIHSIFFSSSHSAFCTFFHRATSTCRHAPLHRLYPTSSSSPSSRVPRPYPPAFHCLFSLLFLVRSTFTPRRFTSSRSSFFPISSLSSVRVPSPLAFMSFLALALALSSSSYRTRPFSLPASSLLRPSALSALSPSRSMSMSTSTVAIAVAIPPAAHPCPSVASPFTARPCPAPPTSPPSTQPCALPAIAAPSPVLSRPSAPFAAGARASYPPTVSYSTATFNRALGSHSRTSNPRVRNSRSRIPTYLNSRLDSPPAQIQGSRPRAAASSPTPDLDRI
ncbi:hypothetical protein DFH09DRAFT_1319770 [Mycena vulgaris]|nr:hypothetical protein DFH09DRAFT_1319770 [Mycena vulgaris]